MHWLDNTTGSVQCAGITKLNTSEAVDLFERMTNSNVHVAYCQWSIPWYKVQDYFKLVIITSKTSAFVNRCCPTMVHFLSKSASFVFLKTCICRNLSPILNFARCVIIFKHYKALQKSKFYFRNKTKGFSGSLSSFLWNV